MELVEFALALQRSVDDFNQSLIEFDLVLRIGYTSCILYPLYIPCIYPVYTL